jgi:hypothetical protein
MGEGAWRRQRAAGEEAKRQKGNGTRQTGRREKNWPLTRRLCESSTSPLPPGGERWGEKRKEITEEEEW